MSLTMLVLYAVASFLALRALVALMSHQRTHTLERLVAEHKIAMRRKAQAEELNQASEEKKKAGSAA